MRIDIYHHFVVDGTTQAKINSILERTGRLIMGNQEILDKIAASDTKIDAMQAGLNGIQTDITTLKELIASGGDLAAIEAAVDALDTKIAATASRVADIDAQT